LPFIAPFYDSLSYQQILGSHHVDIITFYNEVFVPAAKPFLVSLTASGTRPEDKKNPNSMCYSCLFNLNCYFFTYEELMSSLFYLGQISGSPKPSPFPNLPDMSPKKVSSSHNVYVSPLRQTKVFFSLCISLLKRGRGRPKLTWGESVKRDLKDWNIYKEIVLDRSAWRLAINVPEP